MPCPGAGWRAKSRLLQHAGRLLRRGALLQQVHERGHLPRHGGVLQDQAPLGRGVAVRLRSPSSVSTATSAQLRRRQAWRCMRACESESLVSMSDPVCTDSLSSLLMAAAQLASIACTQGTLQQAA